jgi:uncharacterized protein YceH (UPF0502 family)
MSNFSTQDQPDAGSLALEWKTIAGLQEAAKEIAYRELAHARAEVARLTAALADKDARIAALEAEVVELDDYLDREGL